MGWSGIELYYTPGISQYQSRLSRIASTMFIIVSGSPHCRAVLMCIKALELEVDLVKLDMYQKYEHKKPWFIKVGRSTWGRS